MSQADLWQRIEHLRPSLPRHIHIQRRTYGDELWYVLHDKSNGRFHRLSPAAYRLISLMNGRNRLSQILAAASDPTLYSDGDATPTQQDLVELLQYLHVADLLICDFPPSTSELFARQQKKKRQAWSRLLLNPLTWRIPLGNPDRLLNHLLPLGRLVAHPVMGLLWLLVVGYGLLQAGNHWTELTVGQLDVLFSPANLLLLWLTYPFLKVLHELGHGLFTKVWGGHVQEWGVVFIVGTPLPYVDATSSTAFAPKRRRLMVSAAGMAVELFLAAVALLIWLNIEEGLLRGLLYNVVVIGSVSTLFFNGNPLLRFDGYHLLCDAIDVPNLGTRANQMVTYLVQRYGYGVQGLNSPAVSRREGAGLAFYAVAAFAYRLLVLGIIILLVARYFPTAGVVLALWLIFFQLLLPLSKQLLFLFTSNKLARTRHRSLGVTAAVAAVVILGFCYLPLPNATHAEGVLWLPEDARVRSESTGLVAQILVEEGTVVAEGQPLLQLENPQLITDLAVQEAVLEEYQARHQQVWNEDQVQANLFSEDVTAIEASIAHLQERVDNLVVRSPSGGRFRLTQRGTLAGQYLHQGDIIGLIEKDELPRIRAALTQNEIGLVRRATNRVEVRLAGDPGRTLQGSISQQVPAATFALPSQILGSSGGGRLPVDAKQADGTRAAQMVFLLDVALPDLQQGSRYGERAHIRFSHPPEPLAAQLGRSLKQLFISTLQG